MSKSLSQDEEKAFALVYGLLGTAWLLFLATREVLSRLYGEATVQNIVKSIKVVLPSPG